MFPELSLDKAIEVVKGHPNEVYPKLDDPHNALSKAKFNYDLYKFLKTLEK